MSTDWNALIPNLQSTWISGPAKPLDIALTTGSDNLLIAYISFLWPDFFEYESMIFIGEFDDQFKAHIEEWTACLANEKNAIEAMLNHRHLMDIHDPTRTPLEVQLRFLGRTCLQMWRAKLALDYPDRVFEFHWRDEPGLPLCDYQITFNCVR